MNAIDIIPEHRIKDLNRVINEATNKINNYEREKENRATQEINNKLNEHDNISNIVFDFNLYYESELKNKIQLERPLSKDRLKTEKWLKKNDLTEKCIFCGIKTAVNYISTHQTIILIRGIIIKTIYN